MPWYVIRSTGRISILSKSSSNSSARTIGFRYFDIYLLAFVCTGFPISLRAKRFAGSYFVSTSSISLLLRSSISRYSRWAKFSMRAILFFCRDKKVIFRFFEKELSEISVIKLFCNWTTSALIKVSRFYIFGPIRRLPSLRATISPGY